MNPDDADYEEHYGDSLAVYDARGHLKRNTRSTDDHARFRCRECGAAITIDQTEDIEYGHYRSDGGAWQGGMCPHRDEDAVGAGGHPNQGVASGAVRARSD